MKTERKKKGFTIVELLTVMAVMALLLSILAPALRMVRRIAKDTGQKAQFHGIDVALEMFDGENDGYPTSTALFPQTASCSVGAQHLAEALIGRDMLGFDPQTTWDAYDDKVKTKPVYGYGTSTQKQASLDRRKGPYLASENVEAFQIQQLYGTGVSHTGYVYDGNDTPSPVLTDSYRIKTIILGNGRQVKAGTPILYYKANISSQLFPDASAGPISDVNAPGYIFNSMDNEDLLDLGHMMNQTQQHHFDFINKVNPKYTDTASGLDGRQIFYKTITNPKIIDPIRPYNQSSYILMSAGADGIFGTRDDIYNFQ